MHFFSSQTKWINCGKGMFQWNYVAVHLNIADVFELKDCNSPQTKIEHLEISFYTQNITLLAEGVRVSSAGSNRWL